MRKFKLLNATLDLFDGAAGAGTGVGTGAGASGEVGSQALPGSDRRDGNSAGDAAGSTRTAETGGSKGDVSAAGEQKTEKISERERRAEFRRLVEGEYKEIYESEFQKAFDRRFRSARETEEKLAAYSPLIESLKSRYNIEGDDAAALQKAIESDRGYWENAADEAGLTVEQYKEILKLRSDSRRLAAIEQERERQSSIQRQLDAWNNAAREVKEKYPDFDINAMAENREFMSLLRAGVPMAHAYEVLNLPGIKAQAAREAAKATEKNVVDGIRAKGTRPRENGTSSQSGITTGVDISKLSLRDIEDLMARAGSGEVITFR